MVLLNHSIMSEGEVCSLLGEGSLTAAAACSLPGSIICCSSVVAIAQFQSQTLPSVVCQQELGHALHAECIHVHVLRRARGCSRPEMKFTLVVYEWVDT